MGVDLSFYVCRARPRAYLTQHWSRPETRTGPRSEGLRDQLGSWVAMLRSPLDAQTAFVPWLRSGRDARRTRPWGAWLGGMRLGVTQAQPPCPAPSHGAPEGSRCDEDRH